MYANDIAPKCATCQRGRVVAHTTDVVCELYGVVAYDYSCKKYRYDVFTKKLRRKKANEKSFDPSDFSLD